MSEERFGLIGEAEVSTAIVDLLNDCEFLADPVSFATMDDAGLSLYPTAAGVIESETHDITDKVTQRCAYSFALVMREYGQNEERKVDAKAKLDAVGRWLSREPVNVNGTTYQLTEYPALPDGRAFLDITRTSSAALDGVTEDQSEIWAITMRAVYKNEFTKTPIL